MRYKHLLKQDLANKDGDEIETGLDRKKVRKMVVDPIHGLHGFFLCENELFYNHFRSRKIHEVRLNTNTGIVRSVEIYQENSNETDVFEILVGTEQGQVFHGCIMVENDSLNYLDDFVQVLDVPSLRPILEIKVQRVRLNKKTKTVALLACDSSIYQCVGESTQTLKSILIEHGKNEKLLHDGSLSIDMKKRQRGEEGDESDRVKLHFTVNPSQKTVTGFGWSTEYGLGLGDFQPDSFLAKQKNFKLIPFLKKEGKEVSENEWPIDFTITDFHIVFVYLDNVTVLSKVTREVVFDKGFPFGQDNRLVGTVFDRISKQLLVYSRQ